MVFCQSNGAGGTTSFTAVHSSAGVNSNPAKVSLDLYSRQDGAADMMHKELQGLADLRTIDVLDVLI